MRFYKSSTLWVNLFIYRHHTEFWTGVQAFAKCIHTCFCPSVPLFPFPWAMLKDVKKLLSVLVPMPTYGGGSNRAAFKAGIICISSQEVGMVTSGCSTLWHSSWNPRPLEVITPPRDAAAFFITVVMVLQPVCTWLFLNISILKIKLGVSPKEFPLLVAVNRCILQKVQQII